MTLFTVLSFFLFTLALHSSMERLKANQRFQHCVSNFHLHSSMERLKGFARSFGPCLGSVFTFQYGEIKSLRCRPLLPPVLQFTFQYGEIKSVQDYARSFYKSNLHSSMERLKEWWTAQDVTYYIHLHSSMERLKVRCTVAAISQLNKFTFQYGEIKSCKKYGPRPQYRGFTFQYGEIKRDICTLL